MSQELSTHPNEQTPQAAEAPEAQHATEAPTTPEAQPTATEQTLQAAADLSQKSHVSQLSHQSHDSHQPHNSQPITAEDLQAAEQRGYLRGRNEKITLEMTPQAEPYSQEPDLAPGFLTDIRPSRWQ